MMNGGFDLAEEVAAGVRDADGALRFIRRFAGHYARPVIADDGYGDDELRQAEARLGLSLPAALRDVYAGRWLWVRATTREALVAVRHALPGEWMASSGLASSAPPGGSR